MEAAIFFGWFPVALGIAVAVSGLLQLHRQRTTVKAFGSPSRLVTDGVFRRTRNPIYLGLALALAGLCMLFGVRCLLIPVVLFVIIVDRWIIPSEERVLSRTFGPQFEQYRATTSRWV